MDRPEDVARRAAEWAAADPDPETRAELAALVRAGDLAALGARFEGRLEFGTAGLRGPMRAGPMGMNRLVVRQSAAGIARYLRAAVPDAARRGVALAFDGRHRSRVFAEDCADVLTAHGIAVHLAARPLPTPIGVFAIRRLGCAAGIVVTASHNPAADNGLKLYMGDGAQIVPPVDGRVAACIDAVVADGRIVPDGAAAGPRRVLGEDLVDAYRVACVARVPGPAAPLRIALTAMHGVGGALGRAVLAQAGFADVHPVPGQIDPDPDFPTVAFPNPEEPGATDLLAARMHAVGADLGLALDPDADRVAVLVRDRSGRPRRLTGDEVGALLGEWLLAEVTSGPDRLTVTSVVSSSLLGRIAAAHGAHHAETLTGFKWLSRPAMEHPDWTQVLAYEEAIGYAVGPDARDKDGISAALAVASMTAALAARGEGPLDLLDAIHRRHGAHVTANFSIRDEAPGARARRDAVVERLSAAPPADVGGLPVHEARSLAPDVLRLDLGGRVRVIVRPSGTEPKLKCYCEAREPVPDGDVDAARVRATARLAPLRAALKQIVTTP